MLPILIVEDEPNIAGLIEMTLEPLGQPIVIAHDGERAADLLETRQFDLVLLDVMLPGVDGFALMEYIAPTGTPVIFLTAKNAVADRVRGLKLGAYDYIIKPFAPAELLARVEGLLRHTGRRAAVLTVFDAAIDPDGRTVTQGGQTVELTPREFDLLLVLVRERGRTLYRETLYERVWGPDAEPNPRALDLHIHRLRKKLNWAEKIVTVQKVGYRLEKER
ncbi:response regulator transcription factor [Gemmiger sp.]